MRSQHDFHLVVTMCADSADSVTTSNDQNAVARKHTVYYYPGPAPTSSGNVLARWQQAIKKKKSLNIKIIISFY